MSKNYNILHLTITRPSLWLSRFDDVLMNEMLLFQPFKSKRHERLIKEECLAIPKDQGTKCPGSSTESCLMGSVFVALVGHYDKKAQLWFEKYWRACLGLRSHVT